MIDRMPEISDVVELRNGISQSLERLWDMRIGQRMIGESILHATARVHERRLFPVHRQAIQPSRGPWWNWQCNYDSEEIPS